MTVGADVEAEIRRLYFAEHWKRGTIAAQLALHADVVERVLGSFGPKPGTPRPESRVLEPYLAFVDETLDQYPRLVATRLHDMLVERGYTGSLRALRRVVRKRRPRHHKAFLRLETLPGEQAQVDWAHVGEIVVPGGRRPLWAFVIVLSFSRASWGELVVSLDMASLRRSLVRASRFFGGSPRQWLFDNAKTVVVERRGTHVRFNDQLLDLAARLHVQPRVCTPREPHEKGRVERAIRYFKDRFFAARTFHSIDHGNAQLIRFIEEIAHRRDHPTLQGRTVADVFEEERPRLLVLPDEMPSTDFVDTLTADKQGFVPYDGNRYSVPHTHASRAVQICADDHHVRFLDGGTEIGDHERCWGRRQVIELPAHRAGLVDEKRAARDLKGRDRLRVEVPAFDQLIERWLDQGRNVGSMVARTIQLLNAYGAAIVRSAVDEMIERGTHDVGALAVLCEQRRRRRRGPAATVVAFGSHVPECDVVPHDLGGYDD